MKLRNFGLSSFILHPSSLMEGTLRYALPSHLCAGLAASAGAQSSHQDMPAMVKCRYCRNRVYLFEAQCCYCHRRRYSRSTEKALLATVIAAHVFGFGFLLLRIASS